MASEKPISDSLTKLRRLFFPEIVSSPKLLEDQPNPKKPQSFPQNGTHKHQEPHKGDDFRARIDQEVALRTLLGLAEKGFLGHKSRPIPDKLGPTRSSLEIRVVDDTCLIGGPTFPAPKAPKTGTKKAGPTERKVVYSREEMTAMRFDDVKGQKRMWEDVHLGMGPTVKKEYDEDLVVSNLNFRFDFDRTKTRKDRSPSVFGALGAKGRLNTVNVSAN